MGFLAGIPPCLKHYKPRVPEVVPCKARVIYERFQADKRDRLKQAPLWVNGFRVFGLKSEHNPKPKPQTLSPKPRNRKTQDPAGLASPEQAKPIWGLSFPGQLSTQNSHLLGTPLSIVTGRPYTALRLTVLRVQGIGFRVRGLELRLFSVPLHYEEYAIIVEAHSGKTIRCTPTSSKTLGQP